MSVNGKRISLPNLEIILRKTINEKLMLLDYKTFDRLSSGENFTNQVLEVEAIICKTEESEPEILYLVAKRGSDFKKYGLMLSESFKKEVFVYNELIPVYREMELKMGFKKSELFDNVPPFLGYHITIRDNVEIIDSDSYILMENLKVHDYYLINREVGVNYDHAKKALSSLARFHALGITVKQKRPEFFKIVESVAHINNISITQMDMIFDGIWKIMRNVSSFNEYLPFIKKSLNYCKEGGAFIIDGEEPWATITHSHCSINNMMFHESHITGKIDDVKFCNFQLFMYHSAARDLCYFLTTNLDEETEDKHFDDLIKWYYEHFLKTLKLMNCKTDDFTRDAFEKEVKKNSVRFFAYFVISFVSNSIVNSNDDMNTLTMLENQETGVSSCIDRLLRLTVVYKRKKWFSEEYFH